MPWRRQPRHCWRWWPCSQNPRSCLAPWQTHPPACCHPQPQASLLLRSKMPLPPPMLWSLLFSHRNLSSGRRPLLPLLPVPVLSMLTLPANAWLYWTHQWLVFASFPVSLSTAHSVVCCSHHRHFIADHHIFLFLICTVLFLMAPLPPSTVVIPPITPFNPCTQLCLSRSLM